MRWRDVVDDLTGEPRPYEADVAYRARWSLIWAALALAALLLAWLIGTLAGAAGRNPPTTTSTTIAAGDTVALDARVPLHPSRGEPRSTSTSSSSPAPSTPRATTASTSWKQTATTASTLPSSSSWTVRVTCYGPPQFPAGKHTATGAPVGPGSLAVDPRLIPLGSELTLELGDGNVDVVADDTGGAVRGRHVDLWRQSCAGWPNPTATLRKRTV